MQLSGDRTHPSENLGEQLMQALDLGPASQPIPSVREDPEHQAESETDVIDQETEATETEEIQEPAETDGDGTEIRKFTDLTQLLAEGTTAEDLYGLQVVPDNEPDKPVSIGELKDLWQRQREFETEKEQFESFRREEAEKIEAARQKAVLSMDGLAQTPQELREAEARVAALEQNAASVDWAQLEKDDPGEAALTRQKFRDAYDMAVRQRDETQAKVVQQQREAYQQYVARQQEALFQRVPDWRDSNTLQTERGAIEKLVGAYGYTKEDVDAIVDPRLAHLLRDYMLLRAQYDSADANAKQVKARGNRVLRAAVKPRGSARIEKTVRDAQRPDATKLDKHNAVKSLLQESGFL